MVARGRTCRTLSRKSRRIRALGSTSPRSHDRVRIPGFSAPDARTERLAELATDLVDRQVAVIAVGGGAATALAAKAATSTIPIVIAFGADPVELGLVASLNKPGGNITGATFMTTELAGKRLELLCELVPRAVTVAYLRPGSRFEAAFVTLADRGAGALLIGANPLFDNDKLAALALQHAVPAIYNRREFAEAGGLMSFGVRYSDVFRIAGFYVGQILKGTKPGDLPFQQSTKPELVINLKTAKALGLTVPMIMQMTADDVIE